MELNDGRLVTAHVPNTGTMATCWQPGAAVQLSYSDNPRRKLAWTLERVDMGGGWIGVNTARPNQVLAEAVGLGRIPPLRGYRTLRREVPFSGPAHRDERTFGSKPSPEPSSKQGSKQGSKPGSESGRLDIRLSDAENAGLADALIEVKNVTLLDGDLLRFPDARSERGRKHLNLLMAAVATGLRGVMLFALNRPDGRALAPAWDIDRAYAQRLSEAAAAGVEVLAVRLVHGSDRIDTGELLPVNLLPPDQ